LFKNIARHRRGATAALPSAPRPSWVTLALIQIHCHEAGTAQPSLLRLRKLARALRVSADSLVFEQD